MNLSYDAAKSFRVPIKKSGRMRVIEIVPNQIVTKELIEETPVRTVRWSATRIGIF